MTTISLEPAANDSLAAERRAPSDVCYALCKAARHRSTKQEFYRTALAELASRFGAPYAAIQVNDVSGPLEGSVHHGGTTEADWKSQCTALMLDACYRDMPVAKLYDSIRPGRTFAALGVPLREEASGVVGSMVIVVPCDDKRMAEARLAEAHALGAFVANLAASVRGHSVAQRSVPQPSQTAIAKAGAYSNLDEMAFALANSLKSRMGFAQVCLGMVRGRRVRVACISGLDDVYPRSPGVRLICQAMEECLDADRTVCYQSANPAPTEGVATERITTGHLLHKRWQHETGSGAVASIPLLTGGKCVAVLSLRCGCGKALAQADLEKIDQMVSPLVPALVLMDKASRPLLEHCVDSLRLVGQTWLGPGAWGRRALAASALGLFLWIVFGTTNFVITVPCEIVAGRVRQIAAPFEGTIRAAYVRPGDTVRAGQILAELDTRELVLTREKLSAEFNISQVELTRALTARDHAAASQAGLRMDMAQAELRAVDFRLARAQIRAPAAGAVLSGELIPRVGEVVPLGAPLLDFAPYGNWAIELHVPEFAAAHLEPGQTGQFTTSARPDASQACRLSRVELASEVVHGKNVFLARAALTLSPDWIRAGMTGVAKIHAGRRPVWWVGLHRVIDFVRLQVWKL